VGVIPLRVPEPMERAVARVAQREGLDRSAALRRLLASGLERYVGTLYRNGDISLREAADWLALPLREAMDRLEKVGAAGNLALEEVRATLDDVRTWR
jgi:hypothetical protein